MAELTADRRRDTVVKIVTQLKNLTGRMESELRELAQQLEEKAYSDAQGSQEQYYHKIARRLHQASVYLSSGQPSGQGGAGQGQQMGQALAMQQQQPPQSGAMGGGQMLPQGQQQHMSPQMQQQHMAMIQQQQRQQQGVMQQQQQPQQQMYQQQQPQQQQRPAAMVSQGMMMGGTEQQGMMGMGMGMSQAAASMPMQTSQHMPMQQPGQQMQQQYGASMYGQHQQPQQQQQQLQQQYHMQQQQPQVGGMSMMNLMNDSTGGGDCGGGDGGGGGGGDDFFADMASELLFSSGGGGGDDDPMAALLGVNQQPQQPQQQQQQQQANETEKGKDKGRATGKENKKEGGDKSRPADGKVPNKTGANALAEKLPGQMHTTVFVRGLHLDVTKQDVQLKLSRFGSIKSCRLVMDKITGKLKGTAFVDFENKDAAERCASASKRKPGDKLGGISLNGTPLVIDVALTQDGARSLATQRAEAGGKSDKRNLHLSKEGVINAGTEAWEKLSAGDKAKRERAVEERKAKLKNPNMYCSTTRLLIRNVPKDFDEAQLKAVCSKMVKERAKKAKPQIKHAKILMDAGDGKGTPRSRGRAFVEFEDAEHALVCLRQMNNNPAPFGPATRPIVEFAVEDARLKRKMALKVAHVKGSGKRAPQGGEDDAGAAAQLSKLEKKRAWKAKLREKIAERKATKAPADGEEEDRPLTGKKAKAAEAGRGKKRRQAPEGGEQPAAKSPRTDGKRGAKGGAAGGAPLDAATAKGAAKAKRMREQAAREQAHHVKKRREDDLLDRLADDGSGGAGRQQPRKGKNKPKKKEPTDKLDALVGEYTKKLFGGASKGDGAGGGRKAALARWFE
mmetsp:Transcript_12677/g.32588  ORF Transcript_12677/g.32588 Transcript_12677/m.32588 type:complete len:845 (-) Transcript_12677:132-2666(-)